RDKRQRNTFCGQQGQHDAHIEESLDHDHGGDAGSKETPEWIAGAQSGAETAVGEDEEQYGDENCANESQFLSGHGVNEICVRLGQIKKFLLTFHQSHAGHAASPNGDQGLDHVKATSLRIGPRIEVSQKSFATPTHVKEQKIKSRNDG